MENANLTHAGAARSRLPSPSTELVIIGRHLQPQRVAALLDSLLVTDAEFRAGPTRWARLPDPLGLMPLHGPVVPSVQASERQKTIFLSPLVYLSIGSLYLSVFLSFCLSV